MNNQDVWKFYYDEAFHDRKIVATKDNINIYLDNSGDIYVGVFNGSKEKNIESIIELFLQFEERYKKLYGLEEDLELKGTIISKKNFKFGIQSFNSNCFAFYSDFFNLLQNDIALHISLFSKTEFLISRALERLAIPSYIPLNKNAFIYSLIKFLFTYRDINFMRKLFSTGNSNSKEILSYLTTFLITVIKNISGIKRKQKELPALSQLLYILQQSKIIDTGCTQYSWDYCPIFHGFNLLLEERGIEQSQVNLIIDNEENTYLAAKDIGEYSSLQKGDSKTNAGIRISDVLSNFIGRISVALDQDLREAPIQSNQDLQNFDYATKKTLNPRWFTLTENQFNLYKKISDLLLIKQKYYWTAYTGTFFDYAVLFFSLITYIGTCYPTYSDFKTVTAEQHSEYFNTYCANSLLDRYKDF